MPSEDKTLEFLALIHTIQSKNKLCVNQLNAKLAANPDSTHIEIRSEGAATLVFMLEAQSKLLTGLLEENQTIKDHLEKALSRHPQQ